MEKEFVINLFNLKQNEILMIDFYLEKLKKKNEEINLVGSSTLINPWSRHVCDSLQLVKFIKNKNCRLLDIGTGAGLPGILLSIVGYKNVIMVDSTKKKTDFIKNCLNELNVFAKVISARIEDLKTSPVDFIVSRALSPLDKLINYSLLFSKSNTTLVFLKGRNVNKEILDANKKFKFNHNVYKSMSSEDGRVIKIKNFIKK